MLGGGFSGNIYRSTDGGQNWAEIDNGFITGIVRKIDFVGNTVYVRTDNGMFRTTNGGTNWTTLSGTFYDFIAEGSSLYRISSSGVEVSPNQGTSWNSINNGLPVGGFSSIISKYENRIIVSHGSGQCWVSRNNGQTWSSVQHLELGAVIGIEQSSDLAVAHGYGGGVYYWKSPDRYLDSLALVELYDSTNGASWTNNTNWKSANPIDTWYGITVNDGRVSEISLTGNNLAGRLASSVGNLTNLLILNLSYNAISGVLPSEIGNLSLVTGMNLRNNLLSGSIPTELTTLTSLNLFDLADNQLTGTIPAQIGDLVNLTNLTLQENQLTGSIPSSLGSLSGLTGLYLNVNQLSGDVPDELLNLLNLQTLEIALNQFSGLPSLVGLSQLTSLKIQNNRFTFEDIEPNIGAASQSFVYSPQDSVGIYKDTTITIGNGLTFSVAVGGDNNQYQWYKNGNPIGGANATTYDIPSVALSDSGVYHCRITNSVATDLTLYSRTFSISVTPQLAITNLSPSKNSAGPVSSVAITFNNDMNVSTLTNGNIRLHGSLGGLYSASIGYDAGTRVVTLQPTRAFQLGEFIQVTITTDIADVNGDTLESAYQYSFMTGAASGTGNFIARTPMTVTGNTRPYISSLADINLDGDLDIGVPTIDLNTLVFFQNNGNLSFSQSTVSSQGSGPTDVTFADLDNDGDPDLIVSHYFGTSVAVFRNDAGTFVNTNVLTVGGTPTAISTADYDGDGRVDFVACSTVGNSVTFFKNNGSFAFTPSTISDVTNPNAFWSADFDNDGDFDVLVGHTSIHAASVLRNDGNFTFTALDTFYVGTQPHSFAAHDWDVDGDLDFAVGNYGNPGFVKFFRNDGNLIFIEIAAYQTDNFTRIVKTADFNNDGKMDVVAGNVTVNTLTLLIHQDNFNFAQSTLTEGTSIPVSIMTGDMDNDGDMDIVVCNETAHTVTILENKGATPFCVSTSGSDANPGTAAEPFRNIQTAVNSASAGDTIKVAGGVYNENVNLTKTVIILGGYDNSFSESARNIYSNKSILKPSSGTMLTDNQSSTIDGLVFDGSSGAGKGIVVSGGHSVVTHNVVHGLFGSGGAGIQVTSSASATVRNNTLINNHLSGGGVIIYPIYVEGNVDGLGVVQNNIVAYNDNGIYVNPAGVNHDYNCSYLNDFQDWNGANGAQQANDISQDPRFVNAGSADVRLKSSSPCMDAGNPSDDFSKEPAPNGGRIDMGAYGGTSAASLSGVNASMHVSPSGSDANDGSAGSPVRNIQTAINRALGDTIKVAAGAYSEGIITGGYAVILGGYNASFQSRNIYNNLTRINGVSTSVVYDRFGVVMDGFLIDGQGNASRGFDLGDDAVITHNVIINITQSAGFAVSMNGSSNVINNTIRSCDWGVYLESGAAGSVVKNNIINNCSFGIDNNAANGIARYNNYFGNGSNYVGLNTAPGTGDLSVNPQLNNPALLDFRLQSGSLCIDAGDPSDPVGEEPNPNGGRIDMGAYGGTNVTLPDAVAPSAPVAVSAESGDGSITLTWRVNLEPDFLRYRIFRGTSANPNTQIDSVSVAADTVKTFTGLNNGTAYFFRIRALDNSGNLSAYSNEVSATPLGIPSAPSNLTATVASSSQINLTWSAASGFPARYRIFRSLASGSGFSQIDSVNSPATAYSNAGLTAITNYFYVVRSVNTAGVSGASNEASASTLDIAASIGTTDVSNSSPTPGTNITVTSQVAGTSLTVKLFYGKPGQLPGDSVTMAFNGSAYTGTIPGLSVTQEGLWFRVRAQNSVGVTYYPVSSVLAIAVQITDISPVKTISAFPNGVGTGGYFTIALSFNGSLNLSDYFGPQEFADDGNPSNWRALSFNNSTQKFTDITTITGGNAYGLYHKTGSPEDLFSSITNPTAISSDAFNNEILKPGWNLIAWPYTFSANVNSKDAAKIGQIWWMNGQSGWETASILKPYGGYMVRNKTAGDITAGSAISWSRATGKTDVNETNLLMRFIAESGEYRDGFNFVGTNLAASDELESSDELEPMTIGRSVNAYFSNESETESAKLSYDIRSSDEPGHVWDMTVENSTGKKNTKLSWEFIDPARAERIMLIDITHNKKIEMAEEGSYSFDQTRPVRFKVVAGKSQWVTQQVDKIETELPKEFSLSQNYPNPFNPATTIKFEVARSGPVRIKIYNILGQEIATLIDRYYETGKAYSVVWNGRDRLGREVASGLYIYRMETGRLTITKKMMLIR
jgi:parallel beta-helix repeat protein